MTDVVATAERGNFKVPPIGVPGYAGDNGLLQLSLHALHCGNRGGLSLSPMIYVRGDEGVSDKRE